jgi:hypothetical protein
VDPLSSIAVWVINQIANEAKDRARRGFTEFLFGPPLQRALVQPTSDALRIAVRGQLGDTATPEREGRAFDVMNEIWTTNLVEWGHRETLLGRVGAIVARALDKANAPVFGLPEEYEPTSTLTALSDELGVVFDGAAFGESFVAGWVTAVRDRAIKGDAALSELANHLAHEQTRETVLSSEERLGQLLRGAIQSLHNETGVDAVWIGRERWFRVHVVPIDEAMNELYEDYATGLTETVKALRSGLGIDDAITLMNDIRRRKDGRRIRVRAMTKVVAQERARSPFDLKVQDQFSELLVAVDGFFLADLSLYKTWYMYYIEQFEALRNRGDDPSLRSNYSVAGEQDLTGPVATAIEKVVKEALPERWVTYVECFKQLELSCLSP